MRETKTSREGKEIDAWRSGKAHDSADCSQALMAPDGVPLWISEVLPGSVHDITAAREFVLSVKNALSRAYVEEITHYCRSE